MNAGLESYWWPWIAFICFGFLPSELWRVLAVFLARRIDETSPWLEWVRAVAGALLAGIVAKLLLAPNGALAALPLWGRVGPLFFGMAIYFAARRSVLAAVLGGEAAIIAVGYWVG